MNTRVLGLVTVLAAAASVVSAQPALGSCGAWQKVAAAPGLHGVFLDVSASSATDAWAVGVSRDRTLAERWNGSVWRRVPTPSPGPRSPYRGDVLTAVVAIARNDAWAVGRHGGIQAPLLLHWNGVAWRRVALPRQARHAVLWGMTAVSARDVWAVGTSRHGLTRTLRYDGSRWRVVPAVNRGPHATFFAVAAASARNMWAVGSTPATLTEHWDGQAWSLVPASRHGGPETGVAAVSPNEVWAVGTAGHTGVIDRWNGTAWTTVHTIPAFSHLTAVAAASATDAWAVGRDPLLAPAIVVHWDGTAWTDSTISALLPISITSIAHVPATATYWAVGSTSHHVPRGTYPTPRIETHC